MGCKITKTISPKQIFEYLFLQIKQNYFTFGEIRSPYFSKCKQKRADLEFKHFYLSHITIGTICFCALEIIIHTVFAIQMYQRFHGKGKQTIYSPDSITDCFGFGFFADILCYQIA